MEGPSVLIKQGELRGIVQKNIDGSEYIAFKGIPYAKPPVGQLRFKDPEPPEPWSGTRVASEFGSICAQVDLVTHTIIGDDDCLYLNIYTEHIDVKAPRPVMLWVHGGGFAYGSGNSDMYGPDYLVKKDIVLITFNYRVSVFGFLNLEHELAAGNQGLKDQVMALRWIQENISSFGGDPKNVTIFGESAGGASVHYLTLSPLANGLFHKAISQSGVATNPWASLVVEDPKKYVYRLVSHLGKETTDPEVIVEYLRSIDCHKLVEAEDKLMTPEEKLQLIRPFRPGVDSKSPKPFLSQSPLIAMRSGVKVPFLLGYNSHEGILCLPGVMKKFPMIESNFEIILHPQILSLLKGVPEVAKKIRQLYFGDEPISDKTVQKYVEMCGDLYFVNGIQDVVQVQAEKSEFPTYLYKFSYDKGLSMIKKFLNVDVPGTCHGDDLAYLFYPDLHKKLEIEPHNSNSTEYKIVQRFVQMWTDFAKTGNPTPRTSELIPVTWQPIKKGTALHNLSIGEDIRMEINPDLQRHLAWNNLKHKL